MDSDLKRILQFWFNSSDPDHMATHREEWWIKSDDFDREIANDFGDLYEQARSGKLNDWKETPLGCVGLILLLDQCPRNMFRNTPKAFATDEQARQVTHHALDRSFDAALPLGAQVFLYMPLEHSEDIDDQNASVTLIGALGDGDYTSFALQHRDIIERFGRFPHRNDILGRPSTPEELAFLEQPGSSF